MHLPLRFIYSVRTLPPTPPLQDFHSPQTHGALSTPGTKSLPTGLHINHPLKLSDSNSFHFSLGYATFSDLSGGIISMHPNPHLSYAPLALISELTTVSIPSSSALSSPHRISSRPAPRPRCSVWTTMEWRSVYVCVSIYVYTCTSHDITIYLSHTYPYVSPSPSPL